MAQLFDYISIIAAIGNVTKSVEWSDLETLE